MASTDQPHHSEGGKSHESQAAIKSVSVEPSSPVTPDKPVPAVSFTQEDLKKLINSQEGSDSALLKEVATFAALISFVFFVGVAGIFNQRSLQGVQRNPKCMEQILKVQSNFQKRLWRDR